MFKLTEFVIHFLMTLITVLTTLFLNRLYEKIFYKGDIVIIESRLNNNKVLNYTLMNEREKFEVFGFTVDFGKKIRHFEVKSNRTNQGNLNPCLTILDSDSVKIQFEMNKPLEFFNKEKLSFHFEFEDFLNIPEKGFTICMHGNLRLKNSEINLFRKKVFLTWFFEALSLKFILTGVLIYAIFLTIYCRLRYNRIYNLIREYFARLGERNYLRFLDFLMEESLKRDGPTLGRIAEFLLDILIGKKTFIKEHIDAFSEKRKSGIHGKVFAYKGYESLYRRIRDASIKELLYGRRKIWEYALGFFRPNTIEDIREAMEFLVE